MNFLEQKSTSRDTNRILEKPINQKMVFAQRIHFLRNYPLLHDFRVSRRGETRMRARVMPCTLPGRARAVPSTHFPTRRGVSLAAVRFPTTTKPTPLSDCPILVKNPKSGKIYKTFSLRSIRR